MEGIPVIDSFIKRLKELDSLMAIPEFFTDIQRSAQVSREHQKLSRLIERYQELERVESELADSEEMLQDSSTDDEMRELAELELESLKGRREKLRHWVLVEMLPPDESDSRNTVVEIRGGAGGDEANIFAGELYRMYCRFAEEQGWKIELLGSSESEAGGFKEVSFLISGEDVYKTLKYESGVHRVQRVPVTETNGRIHTSTATVAVLPEAEEVDIEISPADLEITVSRASGPGGQGVNTTDSAVQIIHKPTGIMVNCADERSQLKNKNKALTILRSRLLKQKEEEEQAKYAADRRMQVGTGDRSERIRTYNFPQSRLTDHRIGFTSHNLPDIMNGALQDLIHALQEHDHKGRVEALLKKNAEA